MSRLETRIDRLETAMGRRGPADWRFEDMLGAIHAVMWERTGEHLAARSHDLILLNAGSSAGMEDFSAKVVEKLGALLVHGVAIRPGHPSDSRDAGS